MKTLRLANRFVLFAYRYPWSWVGYSIAWDYHNVIASINLLTFQVGFEYVWPKTKSHVRKTQYGWDLIKTS